MSASLKLNKYDHLERDSLLRSEESDSVGDPLKGTWGRLQSPCLSVYVCACVCLPPSHMEEGLCEDRRGQ